MNERLALHLFSCLMLYFPGYIFIQTIFTLEWAKLKTAISESLCLVLVESNFLNLLLNRNIPSSIHQLLRAPYESSST